MANSKMAARRLLSRDECLELTQNGRAFVRKTHTVLGGLYTVEMYNYTSSARPEHFATHNAWELRGVTFVLAAGGETWERYLLQDKFFNYGEAAGWRPADLMQKKVVRVQDKADGSIVSFVPFRHHRQHATQNALVTRGDAKYEVLARTKMSFAAEQAAAAQAMYNANPAVRGLVAHCLFDCNAVPIFELIGPDNAIVVSYERTHLVLLQIRCNRTGEYWPTEAVDAVYGRFFGASADGVRRDVSAALVEGGQTSLYHSVSALPDMVPAVEYRGEGWRDLDRLLEMQWRTQHCYVEGFVVTFDDQTMVKIKTKHYAFQRDASADDMRVLCVYDTRRIVAAVLDSTVDDLIGGVSMLEHKWVKEAAALSASAGAAASRATAKNRKNDVGRLAKALAALQKKIDFCAAKRAEMQAVAGGVADYLTREGERLAAFAQSGNGKEGRKAVRARAVGELPEHDPAAVMQAVAAVAGGEEAAGAAERVLREHLAALAQGGQAQAATLGRLAKGWWMPGRCVAEERAGCDAKNGEGGRGRGGGAKKAEMPEQDAKNGEGGRGRGGGAKKAEMPEQDAKNGEGGRGRGGGRAVAGEATRGGGGAKRSRGGRGGRKNGNEGAQA
eukprot:TRINITY_DN625_c0_g1_i3.p2 TRINITY_DN625_c0_g1~~TRINITY_DN625_c0_g1_i3.p2  ORF type:complete len:614 (+),score=208.12 TRINITY_DN625_c0_g1_i3:61-1902(+)